MLCVFVGALADESLDASDDAATVDVVGDLPEWREGEGRLSADPKLPSPA